MTTISERFKLGSLFWLTAIFSSALLLPRLSGLLSGTALWEDWGHPPVVHLESYRPIAAAELALMRGLFGSDYLIGIAPWFVATLYLAFGLALMVRLLSQWGIDSRVPVVLGVILALHPMFNEFLNWHVLSSSWLAVPLSALGVWLAIEPNRVWPRLMGLVLIALAGATSQLAVMLPAMLVLGELLHLGVKRFVTLDRARLLWRLAAVAVAPLAGLMVLFVLRFGFGYFDFAGRSVGLGEASVASWAASKFYVVSNAIANLYQAPTGLVAGQKVALSAFWWVILIVGLAVIGIAFADRGSLVDRLLRGLAVPAAFLLSLTPLLATPATPTGYRVIAFATIGAWFAGSVVFARLTEARPLVGRLGGAVVALIVVVFLLSSSVDQRVRNEAFARDLEAREELVRVLRSHGVESLVVCELPSPAEKSPADGRGIIVSYNLMTVDRYSNFRLPYGFLAAYRIGLRSVTLKSRDNDGCMDAGRGNGVGVDLAAGRLLLSESSPRSAMLLVGR